MIMDVGWFKKDLKVIWIIWEDIGFIVGIVWIVRIDVW